MRRRGYLAAGALTASALTLAAILAPVALSKPGGAPVICRESVSIAIPSGQTGVIIPVAGGNDYGPVRCNKLFGAGVTTDTFTVPDSGDTVGKWVSYFDNGTVRGTYDLIPQEGSLANPAAVDYLGTVKLTGGTGAYAGMTGKGTSTCTSTDGIHTTCTEKLKLS